MMLKASAKAKWLLLLLKFEIYVGGRAKICVCALHSPFLSLSFPLLLPPLSSVSPLLIFWQLLTDIGAHILFCLTLASLLLVCRCRDSHLLRLIKNKNNTFKVLTSSLKTAKKKKKTTCLWESGKSFQMVTCFKQLFFSRLLHCACLHTSLQLNLIAMARWSDPLTM